MKRATATRWWIPLLAIIVAWLLVFVAGCARLPVTRAITSRPWPETAALGALVHVVNEADGYVVGTVEKAEQDWLYDNPCGLIGSAFGLCNDGRTHAYRLTIRNDGEPFWLYVFVPRGDSLAVPVGTQAVFLWQFYYAVRYAQCRAQAAMTLASCPTDRLPAVLSRDAVAAPGDSALVAFLFSARRQ